MPMKNSQDMLERARREVMRAVNKFDNEPSPWVTLAALGEEIGELNKAVLESAFEQHKGVTLDNIKNEAMQSMAMLLRLMIELDGDFGL